MFIAKVYKIAVISLSGIMEETYAAKETVNKWNKANAEHSGKLFLTVDDEQSADVLVCVIGNRVEKRDIVEDALKAGKHVLLFSSAYQDPKNTIASEQSAMEEYMREMQQRCYCASFNGATELVNY